jgi:hypothetical protein
LPSRWLVHVTLSMGLAWLMLFGPAVEHATYVFLSAPLAWALLENESGPFARVLIVTASTLVLLLGWGAIARLLPGVSLLLIALPSGTVLFALWLIGYAKVSFCGTATAVSGVGPHPRPGRRPPRT